jgi:RecA-family ATPase
VAFAFESETAFRQQIEEVWKPHALQGISSVLREAQLETQFLFRGAIPMRSVGLLIGMPGAGKSWLAYSCALAIARGSDWLGFTNEIREPRPVMVLNYDQPSKECGRRFLRLGARSIDPIVIHSRDRTISDFQLLLPGRSDELRALAQDVKPALIVFDALRSGTTADENDSAAMTGVMGDIRGLTRFGASVLVLHHCTKSVEVSGLMSARGSGAIVGDVDSVMIAHADTTITFEKTRGWRLSDKDQIVGYAIDDVSPPPERFDGAVFTQVGRREVLDRSGVRAKK